MGCGASNEEYISTLNPDSSKERKNKKKNKKINDRVSRNEIYENVTPIKKKVSIPDLSLIDSTICGHFLLYRLSKAERLQLIENVQGYTASKGEYVFKKGDPASMFFIISRGKIGIQINGQQTKTMGSGQYFGELALLYSALRSASVKALEDCRFWCLSQLTFKKTLQTMVKQNYQMAKTYIQKINAFDFLTNSQKDAIAYNMHSLKYQDDEEVFKEGDDANSFYVIASGQINIEISGKKRITLKAGDSFGENSFNEGEFRIGTATAKGQVKCLSIGREAVKSCLGGKYEELRLFNVVKWALKRSQLLKGAPNNLIEKLIPLVDVKKKKKSGSILIEQGQVIDTFIICLQGKINGEEPGKIFYEDLVLKNKNLKSPFNLVFDESGSCGSLSFSELEKVLGGPLKTHLSPESFAQFKDEQEIKLNNLRTSTLGFAKHKLQDFNVIGKLGQGQFGKVYMVERKDNHLIKYALKTIEKNMIVKNEMEVFIQQERKIMVEINFPLIVQLQATFRDAHFIYILMQFIDGGDFFDILREIGLLNFHVSRFYLACFLVCIEYLHSKSIIYRDLKPENAVVSEDGFLHMIDLGTAKFLEKETGFRTFTIIGTPHYMAPQIIEGKGYGFASDIWSLGVILYEMVCGILPYGEDLDDPYDIYKQIEKEELIYPKSYKDARGKQMIKRLMIKNPERRAVEKFSLIKKMNFFEGFDWEDIPRKTMKVPYKPKKRNHKDKKFNNVPLLSLMEKQKKNLGNPEKPAEADWDKIFDSR